MKPIATIILAAGAALLMAACADTYGPRASFGQNDYVDGFYDDFYGPFDTGYWGPDGAFMYRGRDRNFHHDDGGHFRHDMAQGFHSFHGPMAHPSGGGRRPG
jgi:hypothetical protein